MDLLLPFLDESTLAQLILVDKTLNRLGLREKVLRRFGSTYLNWKGDLSEGEWYKLLSSNVRLIKNGRLDLLKILAARNTIKLDQRFVKLAIIHDQLLILKWVVKRTGIFIGRKAIYWAKYYDYKHILEWINKKGIAEHGPFIPSYFVDFIPLYPQMILSRMIVVPWLGNQEDSIVLNSHSLPLREQESTAIAVQEERRVTVLKKFHIHNKDLRQINKRKKNPKFKKLKQRKY